MFMSPVRDANLHLSVHLGHAVIEKKTNTFSSCPHEQFVKIICEPGPETENIPTTSHPEQPDVPSPFSDNPWLENTSKYRYNHQKIKFDETEMKTIEKEIIRLYKSDDGFPSLYQVNKNFFIIHFFLICIFSSPPWRDVQFVITKSDHQANTRVCRNQSFWQEMLSSMFTF